MGAFATVTMPVDLTHRHNAAEAAHTIVSAFPGTRGVSLDETAGTLTFELHFPGNMSGLVRRLHDGLIPVGAAATVSLPVQSLVPELIAGGPAEIAARIVEGAEVWDVAFARGHYVETARLDAGRVVATIVPHSNAMHQIYDSLLTLGLVANDPQLAAARGL
jgi:type III secretion system FlhB-like substrate exporter